jgi:hypothetical protein
MIGGNRERSMFDVPDEEPFGKMRVVRSLYLGKWL